MVLPHALERRTDDLGLGAHREAVHAVVAGGTPARRHAREAGSSGAPLYLGQPGEGAESKVAGHIRQAHDNLANTDRLGGYSTLDLRLEYAITDTWSVQARASNVFDRQYETIAWYNQPGREYGLSLRYRARD